MILQSQKKNWFFRKIPGKSTIDFIISSWQKIDLTGANRYHYNFSSMCVSKTWLFVSWKILGVSQKCGLWTMFDKPEFSDFYGFISHFPNLIKFPKDFQRTSLADSSNGPWSRAKLSKLCPNPVNKNLNLLESCSPLICCWKWHQPRFHALHDSLGEDVNL